MTQPTSGADTPIPECLGTTEGVQARCGDATAHGQHIVGLTRDRGEVIAAIYAYAQWLEDNPDVPTPSHIDATVHLPASITRDESRAIARRFADRYGAAKHTSGEHGWVIHTLMTKPIRVAHTIHTNYDVAPPSAGWL
jgi:hypothetical protein